MNENINLVEILRGVPKGTPLWSSIYGEVKLRRISCDKFYPIEVDCHDLIRTFTEDGRLDVEYENSECVLFPSREQRDWSKFVSPGRKKVTVAVFPFDRVLMRDRDKDTWFPTLFSMMADDSEYPYATVGLTSFKQMIPYCQETAHLVGTANQCPIDYEIKPTNIDRESCG